MCGPLALLSPMGALAQKKPGLATALISPAAYALGVGRKDKPDGPTATA